MSASRAVGWGSDAPTPAQLKEFFAQLESGRITKARLQDFLQTPSAVVDKKALWEDESIGHLRLRILIENVLKRNGIHKVGELMNLSEEDLRGPSFHLSADFINQVAGALKNHGLSLREAA